MNTRLVGRVLLAALSLGTLVSCDRHTSPTEPTPVCAYTISPASSTIATDGGSGTVTIAAASACAWTATASASWIAITSGGSGSGAGTVTYSLGANAATTARSGTITIAGQSHAITQEGHPAVTCSFELSPGNADFNKDGGAGTFTVTAPATCAWTASSNAPWLVITAGGQGTGSGSISYTVARHNETAERRAVIALADRQFTVRQSGDPGVCQYSVVPVLISPCMPRGTQTAVITTEASCPWTATSNASWLTVPSGSAGTGSAAVSITYTDNYDAPREGIVMVRWPTATAGQNIRIAQAGCRYGVSRAAISLAAPGGSSTFDVLQQSDPTTCGGATQDRCVWTAVAGVPWITITSRMPSAGDNPVAFLVTANESTAPRTGRIVVRDQVVTITQAGR